VVPLNSEDLVGDLVELFHFSISQQLAEVLQVLCLLKGTSNCKFLLLLLNLVAIIVPNGDMSPTVLLLLGLKCKGFSDLLLWDIFISRLFDCYLTLQHFLDG
jgi:hypothetical protein